MYAKVSKNICKVWKTKETNKQLRKMKTVPAGNFILDTLCDISITKHCLTVSLL